MTSSCWLGRGEAGRESAPPIGRRPQQVWGLRRMVGERVPGAEAPCFSVGGGARTEVRAYLRSKSGDGGSVLRGCGGATDSLSGVRNGQRSEMEIDPTDAR